MDEINTLSTESPTSDSVDSFATKQSEHPLLHRARRILKGDVKPEDYLAIPASVDAALTCEVQRLSDTVSDKVSVEFITRMRNDWILQFAYGERPVACMRTDLGVIVIAAGTQEIQELLQEFPRPDQRPGILITTPPSWQPPSLVDSLNLSPPLLLPSGLEPHRH